MSITIQDLASVSNSHPVQWLAVLAERSGTPREAVLLQAADLLGYQLVTPDEFDTMMPDFEIVAYAQMVSRLAVITRVEDGEARCAVIGQPLLPSLGAWLATLNVDDVRMADPQHLLAKLESHEASFSAVADAVGEEAVAVIERNVGSELTLTSIQGEASPAVKLINSTVFDALRLEASDIHLESLPQGLLIKFRIDGVLNKIAMVNNPVLADQCIARVKVLAELDIGEKRVPQDGRFRVASKGRDIDIRVSIMPSIHGEDAVLRVLDKKALMDSVQRLTLDSLGFDGRTIQLLRRLAAEPYGMMLVTGPTGSGKTTTLYAALTEINHGEDKVITIEDPV